LRAVLFGFLFLTLNLFAQDRKGHYRLLSDSEPHELYVTFKRSVTFVDDNFAKTLALTLPELKKVIEDYQLQFEKAIPVTEAHFQVLSEDAKRISGNDYAVQKLRNILKVKISDPTNEKLLELAEKLEAFDVVEYCELMSLQPIPPPTDIPPTTSNYEPNQTYLGPNPGVNMNYAWSLGLSGSGIRVRDVEYGFNPNHEDLNEVNVSLASGMTVNSSASTFYTEHGTSVIGIVMADKGTYGISGMAYGAQEMILFPEWQETGYSRINAVTQAIANSQVGDVILYEIQTYGQAGTTVNNFVPAEYSQVVWDLTKAATDAGIIIVAAAGNGNEVNVGENLDTPGYSAYMSRGDSGAIIVGAGTSNVSHNRVPYSTYGTRVDVQGWGQNVFTSGNGAGGFSIGGDFNQSYRSVGGTSSATPIVASCVIVLQSYYFGLTGTYMTPSAMRNLLKATGIPQGTGVAGNIGPLPNMQAALQQIDTMLAVQDANFLAVSVYPNPACNTFSVRLSDSISSFSVEVYDAVGRKVRHQDNLNAEAMMDITLLPSGMYFVKVQNGEKTAVKKLIKK